MDAGYEMGGSILAGDAQPLSGRYSCQLDRLHAVDWYWWDIRIFCLAQYNLASVAAGK